MQVHMPNMYEEQLARARQDYERRGYQVRLHPVDSDLPSFLRGAHPDLLAEKNSEHVVAEIMVPNRDRRTDDWKLIEAAVKAHPDWRFDVIMPGPDELPSETAVSIDGITDVMERIAALEATGELNGAFLLAWSTFEAAMRLVIARDGLHARSTIPRSLVTFALDEGYIDYDQHQGLMTALSERNRIVHGISFEPVSSKVLRELVNTTRDILAPVID